MPWKAVSAVDERLVFISRVGTESFAEACRQAGISRKTGYKWVKRYEQGGPQALCERRSVARANGKALTDEQVDMVVLLRRDHPTWGPKKLRARLLSLGKKSVPSESAIGDVLKRQGLIRPRRRKVYAPREFLGLTVGEQPNDVWCADFKGDFALGDKTRCYALTITDFASRYLIDCTALTSTKEEPVRAVFERVFREFGLPEVIRTDNGVPFASTGVGGLTQLAIWWIKLGITPERIEAGHPEQNGRHERMHRTLKAEATRPPASEPATQQRKFDCFRHIYNDERPHEALNQRTPTSVYDVSRRAMPLSLRTPTYTPPQVARKLDPAGRLRVFATQVLITRQLANELVGVEDIDDDVKAVSFGPFLLGEVRRKGKVILFGPPRSVRAAVTL